MSTRARSMRPPPWRRLGWHDAPIQPPLTIPSATIAEPGTVPDNLRAFQVGVVPRRRGGFEAHTRFCADWDGYCAHNVTASSGAEARALGIAEHIRVCLHGGKETT